MLRAGTRRPSGGLTKAEAERRIRLVFPRARVVHAERLPDDPGRVSTRLTVADGPSPLLVREYRSDPHECAREAGVLRALPAVIPVAEVHHTEPMDTPPWILFSWVRDGPMPAALRAYSAYEARMLANDLGALVSAVHRVGPLEICPTLPRWGDSMASYIDTVASGRLGPRMAQGLRDFADAYAEVIDPLFDRICLCHGRLTPSKVIAYASSGMIDRRRPGWVEWSVLPAFDRPRLAGIVDWASAINAPSLYDVGRLLRMDAALPDFFAEEFAAGYGRWDTPLPANWRWLARSLDLLSLSERSRTCDEPTLERIRLLIDATLRAS